MPFSYKDQIVQTFLKESIIVHIHQGNVPKHFIVDFIEGNILSFTKKINDFNCEKLNEISYLVKV